MIRFTAVIQEEGKAPRALAYESGLASITLGRDSKCEFQIPVPTISRQHCRVYFRDDAYIIQDLRSTYGTLVNEKKLEGDEKKVLNTGDIIELTNVRITVSIEIANKDEDETVGISEKTQALAAKAVEEILSGIGRSQDQDECPYLRVLNGVDEGVRFVFGNSNEWYLGRSKDCDFIVNDPNISRRHAIIRKDWQGYYVEDVVKTVNYKKGESIIKQDEQGDVFFILDDGHCHAEKIFEKGKAAQRVKEYEPCDYFGELALLKGEPRAASIIADTDCKLLSLDRMAFKRLLGPLEKILQRNSENYIKYMKK